mmetsp:Transcript_37521/g.54938  ORF Transcript_37521/g.54938 Transcript_37521/m.54938 type:complete len:307 (-) Transcript_37521:507-1427(-)
MMSPMISSQPSIRCDNKSHFRYSQVYHPKVLLQSIFGLSLLLLYLSPPLAVFASISPVHAKTARTTSARTTQYGDKATTCNNPDTHSKIEIRLIASEVSRNANWVLLNKSGDKESSTSLPAATNYRNVVEPIQHTYTTCVPRYECHGGDSGHDYEHKLMLRIRGEGMFDFLEIKVDDMVQNTLTPGNCCSDLIVQCQKTATPQFDDIEESHQASLTIVSQEMYENVVNRYDMKNMRSASSLFTMQSSITSSPPPSSGWELAMRDAKGATKALKIKGGEQEEVISRASFWHEACMDQSECYFFYLHR